jgi:hypothetical protein
MALHTDLDVYKTSYDLYDRVVTIVENMERRFKVLIGKRIADETADLFVLIQRANVADDKTPHLQHLQERVKLIEMMFRLALDRREISSRQHWRIIELTQSIGRQVTAWKKSSAKRPFHGGQGRHD